MQRPQYKTRTIATAEITVLAVVAVWYLDIPRALVEKASGLHGQADISALSKLGDGSRINVYKGQAAG